MKRRVAIFLIVIGLGILPTIVEACPLCQAGATKKTQKAYEQTTALLALLPLVGGGSIFYWIYRKGKKSE